ncbi:MAG: redoxin family protein [Bacteroidetes bacterium]|jgi:peroxiredoxin|nr:redoxin family protein [Bacteroidota bacterium]
MKKINQYLILLLSVSFLVLASCRGDSTSSNDFGNNSNNPPEEPSDRETAPDFTYTSLEGAQYTLSNYFGDVVYLFFYGADCPHCKQNGPVTEDEIYQEFNDNPNFAALGLDTWNLNASANDNFKNVTGITYPLLLNAEQSLIDYYGNTSSYDRSVVIDQNGKIAYIGTEFVNKDVDEVKEVIEEELAKIEN